MTFRKVTVTVNADVSSEIMDPKRQFKAISEVLKESEALQGKQSKLAAVRENTSYLQKTK